MRKVLVVGVCVLSLVVCCGLAWWQWQRFSAANGTFQNLGYVLQWPLFGLAPAYMFWRLRRLRAQHPETQPEPEKPPEPVKVIHGDDELAEYNRYLARLNADQETR
ncbi:hypothetical protein [Actinokineospora sp.]|uniref:hypothetical protein n=1 Tax=Actinokineospora sp. TaxID=1872133 RepID=UPI004037D86E